MKKPVERKMDSQTAIENAISIYQKEGLKYSVEKKYLLPNVFTTSVYVEDPTCNFTTQGNGKGLGDQSLASALYEGLEHFFSERYDYEGNSLTMTLKEVISQSLLLRTEAPLYEMIELTPDLTLKCMNFDALTGNSKIWYPSFLVFPSVEDVSQEFLCYASNNGIAAGVDKTEALLHSICELVERNAVSRTMIGLLQFPKLKLKQVKISSIPSDLQDIVSAFEHQHGSVSIYDISTIRGLPVYMTVFNEGKSELPICGYGCSLSPRYALERSILECIQCVQLYSLTEKREDAMVLNLFAASREITDMLLLRKIHVTHTEFTDYQICMSVDEMLAYVNGILEKCGYRIYSRVLCESESFCCVKAVIPGFEKFHLIRNGCPVCANKKLNRV